MTKRVVYLAHPVGAPTVDEIMDNLSRARRWLRALVDATDWSIVASWMPYVETLDEERYRARGLADDLACLERCDAIVLVGGRLSVGMKVELDHAIARGLLVVDLTPIGEEPAGELAGYIETLCGESMRGLRAAKAGGSGQ